MWCIMAMDSKRLNLARLWPNRFSVVCSNKARFNHKQNYLNIQQHNLNWMRKSISEL